MDRNQPIMKAITGILLSSLGIIQIYFAFKFKTLALAIIGLILIIVSFFQSVYVSPKPHEDVENVKQDPWKDIQRFKNNLESYGHGRDVQICPYCGREIKIDSKFCNYCGKRVAE